MKGTNLLLLPEFFTYIIPILIVAGIVIAGTIGYTILLYRRKKIIDQPPIPQTQESTDFPLPVQKPIRLARKLIENKSIAQLSTKDFNLLIEECQMIDPTFFQWLEKQEFQLSTRDTVLCILIRMHKTKANIISVFYLTDAAYRTMLSRIRKHLGLTDKDLETFLQQI